MADSERVITRIHVDDTKYIYISKRGLTLH